MESELKDKIIKILSYKDSGSKTQLWDYVCDYLTDELYWDLDDDDAPSEEQIEEVRNIFDKLV
jgi:hypothetical protein